MDKHPDKESFFSTLAPVWPEELGPEVQRQVAAEDLRTVVLDDDPTGTQTVHDVPVLTEWSVNALRRELLTSPAFYVLTNSRSMPLARAQALNLELGRNLRTAAEAANCAFSVISRGDSTLRGHFPGETDALARGLERTFDATLLVPAFFEGGRYTVEDVHYVEDERVLVPVGETEFAKDASFGFRSSNLRSWVQEKTGGSVQAKDVVSFSLADLRRGGPTYVTERLLAVPREGVCLVNATCRRDLEVFTLGLLGAERQGKRYLYRTAASFVQVRLGLSPRPLLTASDLSLSSGGGLTVVGSYVPKTTRQVQALLSGTDVAGLELDVTALLDAAHRQMEIERVARQADQLLKVKDVVIYTSRKLVTTTETDGNLSIGQIVSDSLIAVVKLISTKPRYLLAKGGITSSDVATKGLGVRRAVVLGQLAPGVPVWRLEGSGRYPDLPYIVFPGNVGTADTLAQIVQMLRLDPDS